jgi:ABC-2 type transport system ATP-binding protein
VETTEYAIQTENLVKKYGKFTALNGVSINVRKGDVVGYLGPNGAGKTTTIKILVNLIKPTSGHAYINGVDVNKNPKEALQCVGSLVEVPGVYEYLTPHEMLAYFGKVRRMDKKGIDRRIKEVLELVKISDWEHKKIGSFSTGMQRRLVIAQALLHEPDILIMDEPIIGLDPKGMKDVRDIIKQLQSENKTIFISSHLLHEVSETCTKVVLLDKGKVVLYDTIDNLRNRSKIQKIDVEFLKPLIKEQIAAIKKIELIKDFDIANGHLRIDFDGKRDTCSQILSKLASLGLEIVSYNPTSVTLEDVYVSVMGEERGVG